jgi:hypothetical protein
MFTVPLVVSKLIAGLTLELTVVDAVRAETTVVVPIAEHTVIKADSTTRSHLKVGYLTDIFIFRNVILG